MGARSQAPENPFRMQGLEPGLSLQLEVTVGGRREAYVTMLEEVRKERLGVLVSMHRLQPRPLPGGALVHASYVYRRKRMRFVSEVIGHSPEGDLDYLAIPPAIESGERRGHFRLATALRPASVYRLVIGPGTDAGDAGIDATVVDLSESGCCLTSRQQIPHGERLGIRLELPGAGEITARMRVTSLDDRKPGYLNFRIHCVFTDIARSDRDRIARYLMRRQLEMRRKGQL